MGGVSTWSELAPSQPTLPLNKSFRPACVVPFFDEGELREHKERGSFDHLYVDNEGMLADWDRSVQELRMSLSQAHDDLDRSFKI